MELGKYSMGIGDRFGQEGVAQLSAFQRLLAEGVAVTPVWNKSFREHQLIGSQPADTRLAVEEAVRHANWTRPFFLDADHIGRHNVALFISDCNYFTVDVAEAIGRPVEQSIVNEFKRFYEQWCNCHTVPDFLDPVVSQTDYIDRWSQQYLAAILEAEQIYRDVVKVKPGRFILELSIDETLQAQTPEELWLILAACAWRQIPIDTLAPKFSGRFNKGVDYRGDRNQFAREFEQDVRLVQFAARELGLPADLKLSIHSGSDKFALYPLINRIIRKYDAGLHLKTAGTTWLEELAGLAASGGEGLRLCQEIYAHAFARSEELIAPYAPVLELDAGCLPCPQEVMQWDGAEFVAALRHEQSEPRYNPHLRQLLHVSYKIAAEMGTKFQQALQSNRATIAGMVTANIYRHLEALFKDEQINPNVGGAYES